MVDWSRTSFNMFSFIFDEYLLKIIVHIEISNELWAIFYIFSLSLRIDRYYLPSQDLTCNWVFSFILINVSKNIFLTLNNKYNLQKVWLITQFKYQNQKLLLEDAHRKRCSQKFHKPYRKNTHAGVIPQ